MRINVKFITDKLRTLIIKFIFTKRQRWIIEKLIDEEINRMRCPACGTLDGCGCASPGWPYYNNKPTYTQLEARVKELEKSK